LTVSPTGHEAAANGSDYQSSVEELREIALALAENPEVVAGLESLMSARLRVEVRHVRSEIIIPPANDLRRYIRSQRTQSRHWLSVADECNLPAGMSAAMRGGCLQIFVKAGRHLRNLQVDERLNNVDSGDALVPCFFGSFQARDRTLAAWQAVEGDHVEFDALSPDAGRKLMEAVASVNAIPSDGFAKDLPDTNRWVAAGPDYYDDIFSNRLDAVQQDQWQPVLADTVYLVRDGGELAARLAALGGRLLTHNDINPNNVLFSSGGQVAIFDWEGASLSFAGADLRFLARLKDKEPLLDIYVERINALGVTVSRADVLAGYAIAEGMRRVHRGWAVMNIGPVRNGLALVNSVLDS
jgi:hypothetical protein